MLRIVIAVAFAAPLVAAAANPPRHTVTGIYESNWDEVRLVQDGTRIRGTYVCCGGGTIDGRIEGRHIRYRWQQDGGWGTGVWTVEGNHLSGTWGAEEDDDDGGRWDLVLAGSEIAN